MNKRVWYSGDLANYYDQTAHDFAINGSMETVADLLVLEQLDMLADIWLDIHLTLHPEDSIQ